MLHVDLVLATRFVDCNNHVRMCLLLNRTVTSVVVKCKDAHFLVILLENLSDFNLCAFGVFLENEQIMVYIVYI